MMAFTICLMDVSRPPGVSSRIRRAAALSLPAVFIDSEIKSATGGPMTPCTLIS